MLYTAVLGLGGLIGLLVYTAYLERVDQRAYRRDALDRAKRIADQAKTHRLMDHARNMRRWNAEDSQPGYTGRHRADQAGPDSIRFVIDRDGKHRIVEPTE